jgi:predicted MFS family arabinose efflux permease
MCSHFQLGLCNPTTEPVGRKKAIMLFAVIFLLGGFLQAFATNLDTMMAGRFIAGREYHDNSSRSV